MARTSKQQEPAEEVPQEAPAIDIDAWADEAEARASETIDNALAYSYGYVLGAHPDLRYSHTDGDLDAKYIGRYRARMEMLGYKDVTDQVEGVIGVSNPIVYAIPKRVYRSTIRPERLRRLRNLARRYGLQQPTVHREPEYS